MCNGIVSLPWKSPVFIRFILPSSRPLATRVFRDLSFQKCHVFGLIQYVPFKKWFLSFSNLHLRFVHVFSWLAWELISFDHGIIFHFMAAPHIFLYSSVEGHLRCFQILAIKNKNAMNIHVQVFHLSINFQLIWVNTRDGDCWITW